MRDYRIDLLRGLSLILIFAAHARFSFSDALQHARGFADAADLFVTLAGMSAALAYGRLDVRAALGACGQRAKTLYETHLLLFALLLLASLLTAPFDPRYQTALELSDFWAQPLLRAVEGALLIFLPGNLDILPIYILFLLAAPGLFWLRRKSPAGVLAASAMLWLVSGIAHVNLPNLASGESGWYFDPLSWQFLFVIGIFLGDRLKAGLPLLPVDPRLFAAAALFCLMAVPVSLSVYCGWMAPPFGGLYHLMVAKTNCAPLRVVNLLALVYLAWNIGAVRRLAEHPACASLVAAGRHSLPIFSLGILMSAATEAVMVGQPPLPVQLALLIGGVLVQLAVAVFLERRRLLRTSAGMTPARSPISMGIDQGAQARVTVWR
ncbi:hypothetical protein BJF93_17840 [Xaviernesmea oryzae]|uniref:OpgC protein n=1 Tax=Xaviernesmea oryzae TaxID=464029 RepID=A0A1Q9ATJ4_9HYPH|nr:OpgC domain-containing protein [Xaviernesmea oryzae]OLP58688.1 hypothetical protein BJF93_17840 [Xaviernesmea oryzae]SEK67990.1 hypothetical protein SAMN04487976_103276 [Xaviernesmea oryzae]